MPATTLDALQVAITAAIRGIVPDHTPDSVTRWASVGDSPDAMGLRNFCVEIDEEGHETDGGIFTSDAISYRGRLLIHTGYGGLTDPEYQAYRSADRRQLYQTLTTAGITGLEWLNPQSFQQDPKSERGRRFGAHVFEVRYLLSNITT